MKSKFIVVLVLLSTSAYSMEKVTAMSPAFDSSIADFNSLFFTLGYKNGSTKINHNETSVTAGFTPINNTSSITNNSISLGVMKEFLTTSNLSFSILANLGLDKGQDKGTLQKSNLNFSDKLTGNHFSVGGSLNLNLEAYKIKIQPYVYSSITRAKSKYLLNYSQVSSNANTTTIQYNNDTQQTDIGLGIRFIDPKVQLMSFFSANYAANIKTNTDSSSTNSNGKIDLASNSNVDLKPLTFTIGFGFFF